MTSRGKLIYRDSFTGSLFLDNDTNNVLKQVQGQIPATKIDWFNIRENIDKIKRLSDVYGFEYLFLIAPNKEVFASEFLPANIKISDNRSAIYMRDNFPDTVFYPLELLQANKNKYTLYYKTDTHWTDLACMLVYNEISDRLGLKAKIEIKGDMVEDVKIGDLGNKYTPPRRCKYQKLIRTCDVELVSDNKVINTGAFLHYKSINKNGKRAVIFGDSYTYIAIETVAHYFEELYFFWQANLFDISIIEQLRPDVVINETAERFFNGGFFNLNFHRVMFDKILPLDDKRLSYIDLNDEFFTTQTKRILDIYREYKVCQKKISLYENTFPGISVLCNENESHLPGDVYWYDECCKFLKENEWTKMGSISLYDHHALPWREMVELQLILREYKPTAVLELGLGESTKLIAQYAEHTGAKHIIIDEDYQYSKSFLAACPTVFAKTKVYISPLLEAKKGNQRYCCFKNTKKIVDNVKFHMLIQHCPRGGDVPYADIGMYIGDLLENDFVILIEKADGATERMFVHDIVEILQEHSITTNVRYVHLPIGECCLVTNEKEI